MNRGVSLSATLLAITFAGLATDGFARTEHGSFLEKPVRSSRDLVSQLQDRVVSDRYARHFAMTKPQLARMFGALRLTKLAKGGVYEIYSIDETGGINRKALRVKAGTLVFSDRRGKPVLKESCGNPMVPGSDAADVPSFEENQLQQGKGFRTMGDDSEGSGLLATDQGAMSPPLEPLASEPALIPTTTPTPALSVPDVAPTATGLIIKPASGSGIGALGWILPLGLIGALAGGSGGNSNGQPTPVPEPATMLVLTVGAAGLLKRKARARFVKD